MLMMVKPTESASYNFYLLYELSILLLTFVYLGNHITERP